MAFDKPAFGGKRIGGGAPERGKAVDHVRDEEDAGFRWDRDGGRGEGNGGGRGGFTDGKGDGGVESESFVDDGVEGG